MVFIFRLLINKLISLNFYYQKIFKIIGSAHNNIEILIKQKQGCNLIFVSPIFKVKKKKYFLDVIKFNLLTLNKKIKFVALGGISKKNKNKLNLLKYIWICWNFLFPKKNGPTRRPFKLLNRYLIRMQMQDQPLYEYRLFHLFHLRCQMH